MGKNRDKQRAHLASPMTKEERLAKEAADREAAMKAEEEKRAAVEAEEERLRAEETSLYGFYGIKDPTPYEVFKKIDRRARMTRVRRCEDADPIDRETMREIIDRLNAMERTMDKEAEHAAV